MLTFTLQQVYKQVNVFFFVRLLHRTMIFLRSVLLTGHELVFICKNRSLDGIFMFCEIRTTHLFLSSVVNFCVVYLSECACDRFTQLFPVFKQRTHTGRVHESFEELEIV